MNKKIFGVALVLLMVFTVGFVFAAGASIYREVTTVTVTNNNPKRESIGGELCIYLIHRNGQNKMTDRFEYKLRFGSSAVYRIPAKYAADWTIYDASEISCFVIP